jgi:Protein of unknown function (DUF4236)
MAWFFRKSFRLLPGVRINLSKTGPRLSVGVPGARASIDREGKTRLYGGVGPIRYQETTTIGATGRTISKGSGLLKLIKKIFGR